MSLAATVLQSAAYAVAASIAGYALFLALLTVPFFQDQAIYLNTVTLTWGMDVNSPEQWGFLHNQVTPFNLATKDGQTLRAWHILPLGVYHQHSKQLVEEPAGLAPDVTLRRGFRLLRQDPEALLVLYFHGAAGTLGSGHRPPSYRAISALAPEKIHIVAIDYRGFGTSSGWPSEAGLSMDAITLAEWAMNVAEIPASRIVLFAQSMGTAVAISLAHHYATKPDPVHFSGLVMVAPFADVETLTATYRLAGTIPLLDPVARFPRLLSLLNTFIRDKWPSKEKLAGIIRLHENSADELPEYWVNIIHAEDDYDVPWNHSDKLFWHAVNATVPMGISYEDLEKDKVENKQDLGEGGWAVERRTDKGMIREHIMKYGLHDRTMGYPVVSVAILRAFTHDRDDL